MQFFIIRGGAEGLLEDEDLRSVNACDHDNWGDNDLLAVFSSSGTLIGSARLQRLPPLTDTRVKGVRLSVGMEVKSSRAP